MLRRIARIVSGEIDDRTLAALLAHRMLFEARVQAMKARRHPGDNGEFASEALQRFMEMNHYSAEMLGVSLSRRRWPSHRRNPKWSRRERAMRRRPLAYRWAVHSPERRAWVMRYVEETGLRWTPPPPLPEPRKGAPPLNVRQRMALWAGWPVKTPPGRHPLPREARVLKAVDAEVLSALHAEAGRLRLGVGGPSTWRDAHVDARATHYVFPDPAEYYWPDPASGRQWWECSVLLRMVDGEWVRGGVAVMPETFASLPSTGPRVRQRRLVTQTRLLERDVYLWSRDHEADCSPEACGYPAPAIAQPPQHGR